jgi:molybdate transport system substrate-binding protein
MTADAQQRRRSLALCLASTVLLPLTNRSAQGQEGPQAIATIAAAADLKFALERIAADFQQRMPHRLRLVFGASGNLATQIQQGAPFHLFLSADEDFVFRLADAGRTADRGQVYALGHLGIFVPRGSPLKPDPSLRDLADALKDKRLERFAIANPAHAPYGMRAREALQAVGLWEAIQPRLVLGENISQTAQFVTSGAAQGGLISLSLALAPGVAETGTFAQVPATLHRPLRQRMVLIDRAPPAAIAFRDYLLTPPAQAVLRRFGFEIPKE